MANTKLTQAQQAAQITRIRELLRGLGPSSAAQQQNARNVLAEIRAKSKRDSDSVWHANWRKNRKRIKHIQKNRKNA